jgi:hypothetical protein
MLKVTFYLSGLWDYDDIVGVVDLKSIFAHIDDESICRRS